MAPATQPFHILINAQSGTASAIGKKAIEAALDKCKLDVESFHYLNAEEFADKLAEFMDSKIPLLVGGGDGTIYHTVALCLKKQKPFGILPFGTMNMIAQDLNIPTELSKMFKAYETSKTISIDVGMVNTHPFLCCAALGVMPEASQLREETRDLPNFISMPRLGAFVFNELDKTKRRRMKLTINGKKKSIKTSALVISNNQYSVSDQILEQNHFQRDSLQDGKLGVYTVSPLSFWAKIRILTRLQFGAWNNDPALKEYFGQDVTLETGKEKELISIDGEPLEISMPLKFTIKPKALKVIVPQ